MAWCGKILAAAGAAVVAVFIVYTLPQPRQPQKSAPAGAGGGTIPPGPTTTPAVPSTSFLAPSPVPRNTTTTAPAPTSAPSEQSPVPWTFTTTTTIPELLPAPTPGPSEQSPLPWTFTTTTTTIPALVPAPAPEPSQQSSLCADGDVRVASQSGVEEAQAQEGIRYYPWILYSGKWYPICGHYFWNSNDGATTFCQMLGFESGEAIHASVTFETDAMPVGKCGSGEELTACTAGGNAWGDLRYTGGWCTAGSRIGVQVRCSGSGGPASSCQEPATPAGRRSFVDQHGRLSVQQGRVVDENGKFVRLTGMSLFWSQWMGQFWNEDVVKWLKNDWQCTVIRAAMAVGSGGYLGNKEGEKQKVVAVVDAAIAAGIYVIIDWHEENADQHVQESKAFFGEMAEMYGKYPNVIFETFNEPTDQSWSGAIKPYHQQIVSVIRKHSDNIIVLGTRQWSQCVDEAADDPVNGDNIAYTLHFYSATHGQDLRNKAQRAIDKGAALFVTEWGTSAADGNGTVDLDSAECWLDFLANNGISCVNWSVCDKAEKSAALKPGASEKGGWSTDDLSESGVFVRNKLREYWNQQEVVMVLK